MNISIQDMAENIKRNLEKNGFPSNSVALPLERLYEAAHRDGLNLNKVLDHLNAEGIIHHKTAEKIIFSRLDLTTLKHSVSNNSANPFAGIDFEAIRKIYESLSPEEKASIMEMAKKMGAQQPPTA